MKIEKALILTLDKRFEKSINPSANLMIDGMQYIDCVPNMFLVGDGHIKDVEYKHIDVIKPPMAPFNYGSPSTINAHYNAFLCHKKMAQLCIDECVDNCLFLEDDAYFTDRFSEIWPVISKDLDLIDWDIVYLGWWMERPNSPDSHGDRFDLEERWEKECVCGIEVVPRKPTIKQEICGLHGLLVNETMFPLMANAPWGPMDSFLASQLDRIKAFYVWPKIIHVGPGFSNCENSYTERNMW